jgi:hypothetical protein
MRGKRWVRAGILAVGAGVILAFTCALRCDSSFSSHDSPEPSLLDRLRAWLGW